MNICDYCKTFNRVNSASIVSMGMVINKNGSFLRAGIITIKLNFMLTKGHDT
jgi:hypothetical protein